MIFKNYIFKVGLIFETVESFKVWLDIDLELRGKYSSVPRIIFNTMRAGKLLKHFD